MKHRVLKDKCYKASDLIDISLGEGITEEVVEKYFVPKDGQNYFYIDHDGVVERACAVVAYIYPHDRRIAIRSLVQSLL